MYKKKSNNKHVFVRLEQHVKRYQTLYTLSVPSLISLIALYFSLAANSITKSQIEKEKVPLWDYKLSNEQNSDFKTLTITSLKPDFKILNFEIITPTFENEHQKIISEDNIFNTYNLEQIILSEFNSLYNAPEIFTTDLNTYSLTETYPVIIKINYLYNDEQLSYYGYYKIKCKIYGSSKIVLNSIKFIDRILNYDEVKAKQK